MSSATPPAFSVELGVFDPTFPGITLHYPNEETWLRAQQVHALYYELATADLLQKNPALSASDVTPERLIAHLGESVDNGVPLDLDEKDALGRALIASDPAAAVSKLAVGSAFEHERRHFHDWLLSPYTASINALRTEVAVNYAQLAPAFFGGGTTVVPVPITRWMKKSDDERAALVSMWQMLLGEATTVRLPDLSHPALQSAIENIARRYGSIGSIFRSVGENLDASTVFEASALLIQTQAIHDLYGETACNLFSSTIAGQKVASRYGWFLNAMAGLCRAGEVMENDTVTAIVTWCLLGNNTADPDHAHPLTRFGHAVRCVTKHGFTGLDGPTRSILETLDRESGTKPYDELLRHSMELGDDVVRWLEELANSDASGSSFVRAVAQSYGFLHQCHVYMAKLFLEDPDLYCQPVAYLDRGLGKLPEPPLRRTYGRPFFVVDRDQLDRFEKYTLFDDEGTDGKARVRQTIEQLPQGVVDLQLADNWQYMCGLTDLVFAEHNRDHPELEFLRQSQRSKGIFMMEILD